MQNSKEQIDNLLAITCYYLAQELLIYIYYGQYYSHVGYGCQLWVQKGNVIKQTITPQKSMSFAYFQEHSSHLFENLNMLKLEDMIEMSNILFSHNTVKNHTHVIFRKYFDFKEITNIA